MCVGVSVCVCERACVCACVSVLNSNSTAVFLSLGEILYTTQSGVKDKDGIYRARLYNVKDQMKPPSSRSGQLLKTQQKQIYCHLSPIKLILLILVLIKLILPIFTGNVVVSIKGCPYIHSPQTLFLLEQHETY